MLYPEAGQGLSIGWRMPLQFELIARHGVKPHFQVTPIVLELAFTGDLGIQLGAVAQLIIKLQAYTQAASVVLVMGIW